MKYQSMPLHFKSFVPTEDVIVLMSLILVYFLVRPVDSKLDENSIFLKEETIVWSMLMETDGQEKRMHWQSVVTTM